MFEADNNHRAKRLPLPSSTGLRLAIMLTFILILAGCGAGGTADNSGQATGSGDGSTGKTKAVGQSTPEDGTKTEPEQASEGAGNLGAPALGDPGAPVVMVEYSDYQ